MMALVRKDWIGLGLLTILLSACSAAEPPVNMQELTSKPKTVMGAEECKKCHLEHYDSWKTTLHSRMLQDVRKNADALMEEINPEIIRADLDKIKDKLKVPPAEVFVPKVEDIRYTIGNQWKQRFLVEKEGMLYISPIQYNLDTGRWVNYHEADWDKKPWIKGCGGCHATGVNLEKNKCRFFVPDRRRDIPTTVKCLIVGKPVFPVHFVLLQIVEGWCLPLIPAPPEVF